MGSSHSQSLEQVITSQVEVHGTSSKKSQQMMDIDSPVVEHTVNTQVDPAVLSSSLM